MKKSLIIAFALLAASSALAQDITNHAVPIGGGPGAVGWKTGGPCPSGQALVWSSVNADPQCTSVSGSGSTPGGADGNVQFNNSGTFGGLTDTQLTARIAAATASLSGALPAWPGNTTTFFRGDGTYAALPANVSSLNGATGAVTVAAGHDISVSTVGTTITVTNIGNNLPAGVVTPLVAADGQFLTNGSMVSGGTTLSSGSNPFVAGDLGKGVQCGGTGAAGVLQSGTITGIGSIPGSVTVSFTAGATITGSAMCQWGTDDTATINNAITGLTKGGTILLPAGYIMVSSINMTNTISVGIQGASCGINGAGKGTVLIPTTSSNNRAIIDLTGAQGPNILCLQGGATRSPVAPGACLLIANSNTAAYTLGKIDQVFCTGTFQRHAIYAYGMQDALISNSQIWNYNQTIYGQVGGQIAIFLSYDNVYSMGSNFTTIATGSQPVGNVELYRVEAHDFKPAGGATSGAALWCRGCQAVTLRKGQYDSSTNSAGIITLEPNTATNNPNRFTMYGATLYNENGTAASFCIDVISGSSTNMTILDPSYTCTATRNGTTTYVGFSTP